MSAPEHDLAADGRRQHYRDFYAGSDVDAPLVVLGNCQAESLRLLLDPDGTRSVRVPPVFELEADDLPHLDRLLGRTGVLLTQPVRDDYRDLPLGTTQLRRLLPGSARTVLVPPLRFSGLHPHHVLHHPPDGVPSPPLVPYHDLRVLRAALQPAADPSEAPTADAVRAVGELSLGELRRRERGADVTVSELLEQPRLEDFRTVNHPGNRVLLALATRAAEAAGLPGPRDPGRPLLASVVAPVDPVVGEAWGLTGDLPASWTVDGAPVAPQVVEDAHAQWYADHPDVAVEVWRRFADVAQVLGLRP